MEKHKFIFSIGAETVFKGHNLELFVWCEAEEKTYPGGLSRQVPVTTASLFYQGVGISKQSAVVFHSDKFDAKKGVAVAVGKVFKNLAGIDRATRTILWEQLFISLERKNK